MKKILLIFALVFLLGNLSASCTEGQIDINTASAEELTQITQIGESRAQQLIGLRPFSNVDDLIRISGIGEVYLEQIKQQGLACVGEETEEREDEENENEENRTEEENETENEIEKKDEEEEEKDSKNSKKTKESIERIVYASDNTREVIQASQTIKSEDDNENLDQSIYASYGLVAFCLLLLVLFIKNKGNYKNEFR